jgi:hypothetical protein
MTGSQRFRTAGKSARHLQPQVDFAGDLPYHFYSARRVK